MVATRDDPQFPLGKLRAKLQLNELRALDLRFTSEEAAYFLKESMGLTLSLEDIDLLSSRTEGWIAGLQLAALSLQGAENPEEMVHSFSGSHRFILDYLIEEVLEKTVCRHARFPYWQLPLLKPFQCAPMRLSDWAK